MRSSLTDRAKILRRRSTDAERVLWRHLRRGQLAAVKFRRQEPIQGYVVDFVSYSKRLVIELDGGQHAESPEADITRDRCLRANGFAVLRFWNNELMNNVEGVLEVIRQHL
jgi:crossover junction endodeoxyribonuclease RuvC